MNITKRLAISYDIISQKIYTNLHPTPSSVEECHPLPDPCQIWQMKKKKKGVLLVFLWLTSKAEHFHLFIDKKNIF